ncbi:CRISPR-associated endonuclease Cas2 [Clostridiales bacterium COT073_COT-073]|nr:CRISPR-associated endonuclease Cas2 [Clostridiales bacterium COT073_COT-073]
METYLWDTEQEKNKKVYVLVIYDITDNKRRTKFAKYLNGYGFRVQKSAFEAKIEMVLYRKLLKEITKYIDTEEDSVRIYKIIGSGEVTLYGNNLEVVAEEFLII